MIWYHLLGPLNLKASYVATKVDRHQFEKIPDQMASYKMKTLPESTCNLLVRMSPVAILALPKF